jgi:hypothetical protein
VVIIALDLKFENMGPLITLTEIAELQGRDVSDLIHDMEVAIIAFRAGSND